MPYQNKMIPGINLLYIWANVWHLNTKEWMRRCKYLVLQNAFMSLLFSYRYNISSKRVICYLAIWPTLIQIRHLYCNENTNNNMPNCEHAHHCPFSIIYVWCLVCCCYCCYCCFFHFFLHFFRCYYSDLTLLSLPSTIESLNFRLIQRNSMEWYLSFLTHQKTMQSTMNTYIY